MTRVGSPAWWTASLLLVAGAACVGATSADAQYPRSYTPSGRTTSGVSQIPLNDPSSQPAKPGALRELVCRGVAGAQIVTEQNPSPRSPNQVAVKLAYRRNSKPAGSAYDQLEPGACSWNPVGEANIPAEPGVVHFDLDPQGSAAVPNPATLSTYLGDPRRYWLFYVDDATNISISHGAYGGEFRVLEPPKPPSATALRRERLRCRGGGGLTFTRGARQGGNVLGMRLDYKVAASAAGPVGKGLEPGTCAWADRTDAKMESGRIRFATAGNAQLKQVQSGSVVDTTATAAERWPDVHTIPAYLKDPAHYWSFAVSLASPDTALRHGAWKPFVPDLVPSTPAPNAPTTVSGGQSDGVYDTYDPSRSTTSSLPTLAGGGRREDADPTSNIGSTWHLHDVLPSTLLESAAIRFVARPGASPTVRLSQQPPVPEAGTGFQTFRGTPIQMNVYEKPDGVSSAYTASQYPLERGTVYHYIIDVPGDGNRIPREQSVGQVRTWQQTAQVVFTEIQMVSDGDSDGAGELMFNFTAGDGHRTLGQDDGPPLEWDDGTRHAINVPITGLSADRLKICVSGFDEDRPVGNAPAPSDPCTEPIVGVGGGYNYEWNTARTEVDLTQHPGPSASIPLYFRSGPLNGGSKVMFDVRGYVSVTRQ